jgi:hypothetical protein
VGERSHVRRQRNAAVDIKNKIQWMGSQEKKETLRIDGYMERMWSMLRYRQIAWTCVALWRTHLGNPVREASYDLSGSRRAPSSLFIFLRWGSNAVISLLTSPSCSHVCNLQKQLISWPKVVLLILSPTGLPCFSDRTYGSRLLGLQFPS